MRRNKEITLWVQAGWDHQTYKEVIDTGVPLDEFEKMNQEEREEVCSEAAKQEFFNLMEYGWHE